MSDTDITSTTNPLYDARMVYEIAQGLELPATIAARYGIEADRWDELVVHKPFLLAIARYRKQFQESGYTFKVKAVMQAEDLLATSYLMAKSPETPASVRADLIKWTAKVAGCEPDNRENVMRPGEGFQININLGEVGRNVTIDGRSPPTLQPA